MHPVLFEIFGFPIHAYGLMLALSFLVGIWLSSWRAKRRELDPNAITDMGFYVILSAIVGARLYYVFLHFDSFKNNLVSIFNPFAGDQVGIGGLVMYGGFIGAVIAGLVYFRVKKYPFLPYADAVAPSLGLGIFFTRIGCFLNGCCFGAASEGPVAVNFPLQSPAGAHQHAIGAEGLFPSQLFLSVGGLAIAVIVLLAGRKKLFDGFEFYLTGILYAILRFAADFTRYYAPSEKLGMLSHNQIVCIGLFVVFGGLMLRHVVFKEELAASPGSSSTQ